MEKLTINKLSTAGILTAIAGLVVLSNPFSNVEFNKASGYGYAGYAGYGSTGNVNSLTIKDDCRVNGTCSSTNSNTTTTTNTNTTTTTTNTNTTTTTEVKNDRIVKTIGDKKYSLSNVSCQVSADIANPNHVSNVSVSFNDIAGNSFESDIKRLAKVNTEFNKPVVSGTTPTTFEPNRSITRAEFLAVVLQSHCIDVYKKATSTQFTDLKVGDWKTNVVEVALEKGIIAGDVRNGKKVFRPNDAISKIEAIAILTSMRDLKIEESNFKHSFTDAAADWQNRVLSLVEYLEIEAKSSSFNPNATVNRAKMTNYIVKTIELY